MLRSKLPLLASRRRWLSSSPVDQSFTSTSVARDGRVFRFATVVIHKMGRDQSALPAWQHACSLVNANPPTLAIAFLSKATTSALAAVRDFAHQFSHQGIPSHDVGNHAEASCRTQHSHYPHPTNASLTHHGCTSGENPTICGTREGARPYIPAHGVRSAMPENDSAHSTGNFSSMPALLRENTCLHVEPQLASIPPLIGCIFADQERVGSTTSIVSSDTILWLDALDDTSDNSSIGGEGDGGAQFGGNNSGFRMGSLVRKPGNATNMQPIIPKAVQRIFGDKNITDEITESFMDDLITDYDYLQLGPDANKHSKDQEDCLEPEMDADFIVDKGMANEDFQGHPADFSIPNFDSSRSLMKVQSTKTQLKELTHAKKAQRAAGGAGEVPKNCIKQKTFSQHTCDERARHNKETTDDSGKHAVEEDETYRLLLCVANMPGVKATGFYSRSGRLPWLPDLANAVTTDNPHILLLSTPGFNLSEFNERLGCMFPNGSRAGASLLINDDGKVKGWRDHKGAQLFCGLKLASTGAVGLSLSPAGEADFTPVDIFAEFVRMSLGMLHGSCWDIYFDEAVCKSLFLPQSGEVEWLDPVQRAYKVNPDSVLDKIYTKLHSKDATYTGEPHKQISVIGESEKLPIITVDKVLFPGFFIPLFIENPCDRLTVRQCVEHCKPFGVSSPCTEMSFDPVNCKDIVGTIANVKVSLFDKGCKSYIIAHGVRRFRVKNRNLQN